MSTQSKLQNDYNDLMTKSQSTKLTTLEQDYLWLLTYELKHSNIFNLVDWLIRGVLDTYGRRVPLLIKRGFTNNQLWTLTLKWDLEPQKHYAIEYYNHFIFVEQLLEKNKEERSKILTSKGFTENQIDTFENKLINNRSAELQKLTAQLNELFGITKNLYGTLDYADLLNFKTVFENELGTNFINILAERSVEKSIALNYYDSTIYSNILRSAGVSEEIVSKFQNYYKNDNEHEIINGMKYYTNALMNQQKLLEQQQQQQQQQQTTNQQTSLTQPEQTSLTQQVQTSLTLPETIQQFDLSKLISYTQPENQNMIKQQLQPSYNKSKLKMKTYEFIIMIVLLGILGLLSCFATYRIMKSIPHAICGCVFSFVYITLMWLWFGLFTNKKLK